MKYLNDQGVRFNGAAVSRTMMSGILILEEKVTEAALGGLRAMEQHSGRDLLTGGYAKLARLAADCSTAGAAAKTDAPVLIEYVLENLSWAVRFD